MNDSATSLVAAIWHRNPTLLSYLGLCPLLAISSTVANGLVLGLASTAVLLTTNLLISLLRGLLTPAIRIPAFVLIIAAVVTAVDLLLNAFLFEMYRILGLFIPLIVTNCVILGQAETVASREPPAVAVHSALTTGTGFIVTLVLLGAARELVGHGTLFSNMDLILGEWAAVLEITLPFRGLLLALLPPGAFFALAGLAALNQHHGTGNEENKQ